MSFNQNEQAYFSGQQGAEDGSTPGGAPGPQQGQMQPMDGGQGHFSNMQVGGSGNDPDSKTTLWYATIFRFEDMLLTISSGWVSLSHGSTRTSSVAFGLEWANKCLSR